MFKAYKYLFVLFCCLLVFDVHGQSYMKMNSFTSNEGLPSNHIYDITEDDKGFLWVATDNGISRFDGKYFQNFSVKNGLPSNDVLQVAKDGCGIIWVNCYKQLPAYFDDVNNRFITINDSGLNNISKSLLLMVNMPDGSVRYHNASGSAVFKNRQLLDFFGYTITRIQPLVRVNNKEFYIDDNGQSRDSYNFKYYLLQKNVIVDSFYHARKEKIHSRKSTVDNNQLYIFSEEGLLRRFCISRVHPVSYTIDSVEVPGGIRSLKFSGQYLSVVNRKGVINIYDRHALTLKHTIPADVFTNCAYIDGHNNLWLGTLDNGLIYYNNNGIKKQDIPQEFIHTNFSSLALNSRGALYAGNYYTEIIKINKGSHKTYNIQHNEPAAWVRKIICLPAKVVVITDNGYCVNFEKRVTVFSPHGGSISLKGGIGLNDSIIVLGGTAGLHALNTITNLTRPLNSLHDRALNVVKANDHTIYYIGLKGLYKYDHKADSSYYISLGNGSDNNKLSVLAFAHDGSLWAGKTNGDIVVLKHDKLIASIPNHAGLPENMICMMADKNKIWIGSKTGISIIDYNFSSPGFNYAIRNLSKTDGLPSNTVNDLLVQNETVYAATENGIALIPANFLHPEYKIVPQLISVKINQVNVPLSDNYQLKSDENNITLVFSGIELSGHFKNMQYAIDKELAWADLTENTLTLQLNSGDHIIYIRAKDVNGRTGAGVLKINISIATPFFQTIWFWALIAILTTAIIFWLFNRRRLARQKTAFQQQLALEQQRNKITADLHDDIGASLSSLQVNSAVANRLIDKDAARAKLVLTKIQSQSRNLADKIGDIIWSMKPGKDEFMGMSSRIKNFANDILGATNINYQIKIDKEIDTLVKDITVRKNIVFITREAINNAVKYGKAAEIIIQLKLEPKNIRLSVTDNGIGFDMNETAGNGIANMRKRAEEINAGFSIHTTPQQGTAIDVIIPIP